MKMREKTLKRRRIFKGRNIDFYCDSILLPDGKTASREYTSHPGATAVVPFLGRDNIVLVKQYRYPVDRITLEIPAGKLAKGESSLNCVRRELLEETGYRARRIRKLTSYCPSTAFSTEILHIYVADRLKLTERSPDEDEFIESVTMPFRKALGLVYRGVVNDSKTMIALLYCEILMKENRLKLS